MEPASKITERASLGETGEFEKYILPNLFKRNV